MTELSAKWSSLPAGPSLKNLTDGEFGTLHEKQDPAIQDLTRAHLESFDQAVTDGLSRVVQVGQEGSACKVLIIILVMCLKLRE